MSFDVPTPKQLQASFPVTTLTPIEDKPTYAALNRLRKELQKMNLQLGPH